MDHMNFFKMYIENGFKLGFYVRKNSWAKWREAKVVAIEGVIEGEMIPGEGPYYDFLFPPDHPKAGKFQKHRYVTLEAEWLEEYGRNETGGIFSYEVTRWK